MDIQIQEDFDIEDIQKGNDIAVLILTNPSDVQPIPLPIRGFPSNTVLLALGWGQDSTILQQLFLNTVSRKDCLESYPDLGTNIHCARSEVGDTCKGMVVTQVLLLVHL